MAGENNGKKTSAPAADQADTKETQEQTPDAKAAAEAADAEAARRGQAISAAMALQVGQPKSDLSPMDVATEGEDIVTANVPKVHFVNVSHHQRVKVPAGIVKMPLSLFNHWYTQANGVTKAE